jgi:hypothetical protein
MTSKAKKFTAGGIVLAVLGLGGLAVAHFSLSSLTSSAGGTPASVQQLLATAKNLPPDKAAIAKSLASSQAAAIAKNKTAPTGPVAADQGRSQVEQETAAAPTPQYDFGLHIGNQPPGLPFESSGKEWETRFQGAVYQVFGGVTTNSAGNPVEAAVLVERDTTAGQVVVVGTYTYAPAGKHYLVETSYSGTMLRLSYANGGVAQFNLANDTFTQ